jgi:glycosyltransferase involved in cell wall biosynthesis
MYNYTASILCNLVRFMQKTILVSVSNDLSSDQRVHKICTYLTHKGYQVKLIGRRFKDSKPLNRNYKTQRMYLLFKGGPAFYFFFNVRLFFILLFTKSDMLLSNDLDTLPANYMASLFKRKNKLIYDSHEYFTEAEGLTGKNFKKKVWEKIEKYIFPKVDFVYTVNESIAQIYSNKYKKDVWVVRNCPLLTEKSYLKTRSELGLPEDKKILLVQGAYIDPDRGVMEALLAMQYIEHAILLIIGSGREIKNLKQASVSHQLTHKVLFIDKMPYEELIHYTHRADIGLTLDKPIHLNYKYSLPNKIFDYIHAGLPVVASRLPEIDKVFAKYEIGMQIPSHDAAVMAQIFKQALYSDKIPIWKNNLKLAAEFYNWQNEIKVLNKIF